MNIKNPEKIHKGSWIRVREERNPFFQKNQNAEIEDDDLPWEELNTYQAGLPTLNTKKKINPHHFKFFKVTSILRCKNCPIEATEYKTNFVWRFNFDEVNKTTYFNIYYYSH